MANHTESFVEYTNSPKDDKDDPNFHQDEQDNVFEAFFKDLFRKSNLKSLIILALFIACGTIETVDYSLNGKKFMVNYLTVLNLLVVFVATGFFWFVVMIQTQRGFYTDHPHFKRSITLHPKWFFVTVLVMALCDTIALYVAILASRDVTAPLRNMLQQGNIPITMLLSRFYLGHRYSASHFTGAGCIIGGIALVIWQVDTHTDNDENHDTSNAWWSLAFFLSCIPMSLSICLKEHVLNHHSHPVDMHLVNACVTGVQLVLGLILCPISYMVTINTFSLDGLSSNLTDGIKCAMSGVGCNSQCDDVNSAFSGVCYAEGSGCNLEYAPASVWLYILVCCLFNLLMLWVISENTAALYFVALAAIIPVVSLISTSSIYSAIDLCTVTFDGLQVLGLVIVVVGIAVYRIRPDDDCMDDDDIEDEWTSSESISREIYGVTRFSDLERDGTTNGIDGQIHELQKDLQDSVNSFHSLSSEGSRSKAKGRQPPPRTPPQENGSRSTASPRGSPALSQDQYYNGYADKHVRDLDRGRARATHLT